MNWTALDRLGTLVRVQGQAVSFPGAGYNAHGTPYVPVCAFDPDSGICLMAYRDANVDSVHFIDSRGVQGKLAEKTVGKWPIAIRRIGPGVFNVAWIQDGLTTIGRARMTVSGSEYAIEHSTEQIPAALILLTIDPITLDLTDAGYNMREVTRAGLTIPLIYPQEENGRIVGVDGRPGAPNQALLADGDGWYTVTTDPASALFPPRIDVNGNVATFEGQYYSNEQIRQSPIAVDPSGPQIPPVTPAPGSGPIIYTAGDTSALGSIAGVPAELLIGGAIIGLAIIVARKD
jgi:hypothetical protein